MIDNILKIFRKKSVNEIKLHEMLKEKTASEWLNPKNPEFSEAEHKLALTRMVFDVEVADLLFSMAMYIKMLKNNEQSDKMFDYYKEHAIESSKYVFENLEKDVDEWWEAFMYKDSLDNLRTELFNSHAGDCTAYPCTCMRCLAEDYYKIPSTVKWNKGVGYQLWQSVIKSAT